MGRGISVVGLERRMVVVPEDFLAAIGKDCAKLLSRSVCEVEIEDELRVGVGEGIGLEG